MNEWISVEDKLPDYNKNVLVSFLTGLGCRKETTATLYDHKVCADSDRRVNKWYVTVSQGHVLKTITHWMPIPELPEERLRMRCAQQELEALKRFERVTLETEKSYEIIDLKAYISAYIERLERSN